MKAAAALMFAVLAVLVGIAAARGDGTLLAGAKASVTMMGRFLPILLVAVALSGFVEVLLPQKLVESWLSDGSAP